jgi:hypothetical protein
VPTPVGEPLPTVLRLNADHVPVDIDPPRGGKNVAVS